MPETERRVREAGQISRAAMLSAIIAVLIALIAAGVTGWLAHRDAQHSRAIANQAKAIADENRHRININAEIGVERRKVLLAEDVKICRRFHTFYSTVHSIEQRAIDQGQKLVDSGVYDSLDPAVKAAAQRQLSQARGFLVQLKRVDCATVPSLTPSGKPRKRVVASR